MGPKQPPSSELPASAFGATQAPSPETAPETAPETPGLPGDSVTVEAATAEQALEEVTGLLGADAEILRADKVQRGGIGGFFAKEVVQLTARKRSGEPAGPAGPANPAVPVATQPPAQRAQAAQAVVAGSGQAHGTDGVQDPFAEALGRFLAEQTDTDASGAPDT